MTQIHKCGKCEEVFNTEAGYCAHTCTTGFKPTDVEHQDILTDGQFSLQSTEALKRGAERTA